MIPTIETIVEDLIAGKISASQAIAWLHAHAEGAANELRDHYAGLAMQGLISRGSELDRNSDAENTFEAVAMDAYSYADSMLKVRES